MTYRRTRAIFAVLFVLSVLWLLYVGFSTMLPWEGFRPAGEGTAETLVLWATIAMPVLTATGLIISTVFAWRQDRREQEKHRAEMARLEQS